MKPFRNDGAGNNISVLRMAWRVLFIVVFTLVLKLFLLLMYIKISDVLRNDYGGIAK